MCGNMVDIQPPTAEIRRGKKRKIEEEERSPSISNSWNMDGLLVDLRDNVSITVYFDFTYSGLHRCIVFFLSFVSLLHYLAIQPSRLQGCSNKISLSVDRAKI